MKHSQKYLELLNAFKRFNNDVQNPKRQQMWHYCLARKGQAYEVDELAHRVAAANDLGYDVQLVRGQDRSGQDQLQVQYVAKRPSKPWELFVNE
jgi:hypothetical protein